MENGIWFTRPSMSWVRPWALRGLPNIKHRYKFRSPDTCVLLTTLCLVIGSSMCINWLQTKLSSTFLGRAHSTVLSVHPGPRSSTAACLQDHQQGRATGNCQLAMVRGQGVRAWAALPARNEGGQGVRVWLPEPTFKNRTCSQELSLEN